MDDFLTYFFAGMFGAELIRKIATRPYGFLLLWLIWFVLVNIFFILLAGSVIVLCIFTDPAAEPSILRYIGESFALIAIDSQPWSTLLSLAMGFMFALSYWGQYKLNQKEKQKNETNK